jgi:hypothetical protein
VDKISQGIAKSTLVIGGTFYVLSESAVPGGSEPKVVVVVVIRVVVDVETIGVEVADVDAVTVRIKIIACFRQCHCPLISLKAVFYSGVSCHL